MHEALRTEANPPKTRHCRSATKDTKRCVSRAKRQGRQTVQQQSQTILTDITVLIFQGVAICSCAAHFCYRYVYSVCTSAQAVNHDARTPATRSINLISRGKIRGPTHVSVISHTLDVVKLNESRVTHLHRYNLQRDRGHYVCRGDHAVK